MSSNESPVPMSNSDKDAAIVETMLKRAVTITTRAYGKNDVVVVAAVLQALVTIASARSGR